eukprot:5216840-Pleurochrysis_carterae.AAC.1
MLPLWSTCNQQSERNVQSLYMGVGHPDKALGLLRELVGLPCKQMGLPHKAVRFSHFKHHRGVYRGMSICVLAVHINRWLLRRNHMGLP